MFVNSGPRAAGCLSDLRGSGVRVRLRLAAERLVVEFLWLVDLRVRGLGFLAPTKAAWVDLSDLLLESDLLLLE